MSSEHSEEVTFLRQQLAQTSLLLKYSLKSNRPFDSHARAKVNDALAQLDQSLEQQREDIDQNRQNFDRVSRKAHELELFVQKQDELSGFLREKIDQLETENAELKRLKDEELSNLKETSHKAIQNLEKLEKEVSKIREERDTSRD